MQIVYRSKDIAEAHIVSGMLHAQGIEAFVDGHYLQGAIGELGLADTTLVRVNDDDYPKAREIVAQYDASVQHTSAAAPENPIKTHTVLSLLLGFLLLVIFAIAVVS